MRLVEKLISRPWLDFTFKKCDISFRNRYQPILLFYWWILFIKLIEAVFVYILDEFDVHISLTNCQLCILILFKFDNSQCTIYFACQNKFASLNLMNTMKYTSQKNVLRFSQLLQLHILCNHIHISFSFINLVMFNSKYVTAKLVEVKYSKLKYRPSWKTKESDSEALIWFSHYGVHKC